MKRKIILDCDNTIGIPGCDVDDGLALLFLLGSKDAQLLGITNSFGNSRTDTVYENTKAFLKEIGREDIPVYKGGAEPGDYHNEASAYLARMSERYAGSLEILASGSLTNIAGAARHEQNFYKNIKGLYCMGGIREDLIFAKKKMDELNFSVDYRASYEVLTADYGSESDCKVHILSGNNCLKVLFTLEEYQRRLLQGGERGRYIWEKTAYWFADNERDYGIPGFYNWDVTAAAYMLCPWYFTDEVEDYALSPEDLQRGFLRAASENANARLNLPKIKDSQGFTDCVYAAWLASCCD